MNYSFFCLKIYFITFEGLITKFCTISFTLMLIMLLHIELMLLYIKFNAKVNDFII